MNCRRVSNLLSAYVDKELAGAEMLEIRAHLSRCSHCQNEHDQLQQTKQLLGALALRAPRDPARYEALLLRTITEQEVRQSRTSSLLGWLPDLFGMNRMNRSQQHGGSTAGPLIAPGRLRTAGVAFALSLAGLLVATTTPLDRIIVGNDSTPESVRPWMMPKGFSKNGPPAQQQQNGAAMSLMATREPRAPYGFYDIDYNAPSHPVPVPTDPQPLPVAPRSAPSVSPIGYDALYRRSTSGMRPDWRPAYAGFPALMGR